MTKTLVRVGSYEVSIVRVMAFTRDTSSRLESAWDIPEATFVSMIFPFAGAQSSNSKENRRVRDRPRLEPAHPSPLLNHDYVTTIKLQQQLDDLHIYLFRVRFNASRICLYHRRCPFSIFRGPVSNQSRKGTEASDHTPVMNVGYHR